MSSSATEKKICEVINRWVITKKKKKSKYVVRTHFKLLNTCEICGVN